MSTAWMGGLFLVVGFAAMFLMYRLWGYPFDHKTNTSEAPRWAMRLHRGLGYLFVALYVALMWHMVPRLWQYQVEFPARTTFHIVLGFTVGFLLLIKVAIMRFFRHFEEWMPYLGTMIMLCTVLLIGLSLPFVLQERALAKRALGGDVFSPTSLTRVTILLPTAGFPTDVKLAPLSTVEGLEAGRTVLLDKCVACHDLKTILAKPRPPAGWWETVDRMADKPALFSPMTEDEEHQVTAYLIAITPDLQRSTKRKREEKVAVSAAITPAAGDAPPAAAVDLAKAKTEFASVCAGCHDITDVDAKPPKNTEECGTLVQRMIKDNEAKLTSDQVTLITAYLAAHYVAKTAP